MKVYISVDMEGITGVTARKFVEAGTPQYNESRPLIMSDVNAAVEGAIAGGADEVIVIDCHSGSFNFIFDQFHPKAKLIWGVPGQNPRFPLLDESFAMMFLLGYHAMAGTYAAVCEHTMTSAHWHRVTANGTPIGEVAIDAAIAGECGVPVTLVSGDDKVCAEAKDFLGDIETAVVKTGLGRHRALCLPKETTRVIIREAAERAVRGKKGHAPYTMTTPIDVAITYKHVEDADSADSRGENEKRIDGYTVSKRYPRMSAWYGGLWKDRISK